jgi:CRISPR-associated protein Cmr6
MEKGTLIVFNTKKGWSAKIAFTKADGKAAEMPATGYVPKDQQYNDTPCTFRRDRGVLVELIAHDGTSLLRTQAAQQVQNNPSPQAWKGEQVNHVPDSYLPESAFMPKDTYQILERIQSPDNFALKLNKVARYDPRMEKFQFFKRDRKGENYQIRANFGAINFESLCQRERNNAQALLGTSQVREINLSTEWRLVQGLGIESVYEISLTLHHVFGVPYLPASSIKGIVRSWIITEAFGSEERLAIQDKQFCTWFGCPAELRIPAEDPSKRDQIIKSIYGEARQGQLVFFDAFPRSAPKLEVDVMNPHYGPYYADRKHSTPPADYHNPVPVFFLTLSQTTFQFLVGAKREEEIKAVTLGGKTIEDWLRAALTSHGIGAKTAVGYGYFTPPKTT